MPPVTGRPWKLPHYANRGKTSSSGGELASARSCFSTVRTALGKLRITGLLARFDVARTFPQFPRPLLLQPTIWTSERGADLGSGRCQPRPHLPIYRMTLKKSETRSLGPISHGWWVGFRIDSVWRPNRFGGHNFFSMIQEIAKERLFLFRNLSPTSPDRAATTPFFRLGFLFLVNLCHTQLTAIGK